MPGICAICPVATLGMRKYCTSCSHFVQHVIESAARVVALKRARRQDGFHCEYSGALLNTTDPSDPFYLHFDHRVPGVKNDLAAAAAIVNESKVKLTYLEFPLVVHEAVNHWDTGAPFRRDVVPYSAWLNGGSPVHPTNDRLVMMAVGPRLLDAGLLVPAGKGMACGVCERYAPVKNGFYCPRCGSLLFGRVEPYRVLVAALKKAYDYELDAFICYHLGVPLEVYNWQSPYYICYDHLVPKMKGNIVVSSVLANMMKTDTDEQEWHAYFRMLDVAMQGGKFEQEKLEFKYYTRNSGLRVRKVA